MYLLGRITSQVRIAADNGPTGFMTVRGDYPGRACTIDGQGLVTHMMEVNVPGRQGYIIRNIKFTGQEDNPEGSAIRLNETFRVEVRGCSFIGDRSSEGRIINLFGAPTDNTLSNILVAGNRALNWGSKNPRSSESSFIYMQADTTDASVFQNLDVFDNDVRNCGQFFRNPVFNTAVGLARSWPVGIRIYNNYIENCERAIQQVHWQDGSGANPSYIRGNTIIGTGTPGAVGVGNDKMNVIQVEAVEQGDISVNYIDGWEKEDGNGDGAAIILDWFGGDSFPERPEFFSEGTDVFGNTIKNGMLTVTDPFTFGGIQVYRAKDCKIYSNHIENCHSAFVIDGQTEIAPNNTGNEIYNNTIVRTLGEAIRFGPGALQTPFRNNIFDGCESLFTANAGAQDPDWDYNCYHNSGAAPPWAGLNDITDSPQLYQDKRLKTTSPCANTGDNTVLPLNDLTGVPFTNPINMGAFEETVDALRQTLPDAKFDSLRTQGFSGSVSDMILEWLQLNGATSNSVPDAWREMLDLQVASPTGQRNDDWFALLGSLGYTQDSLNDRELAFWQDGGLISTDLRVVIQQLTPGVCQWNPPSTECTAQSTYEARVFNSVGNVTYSWVVTDGGPEAAIVGPADQQTVTIETTSNQTENFDLQVTVTDDVDVAVSPEEPYSHSHSEAPTVAMRVTQENNPRITHDNENRIIQE